MSWNTLDNSRMGNEGGYMDTSTQGGDQGSGVKRAQNIVPVMITHIKNVGDKDELSLWGTNARMITTVGIVRNCEMQSTKASYTIEDETGSISVVKFLDQGNTANEELPVQLDTYARVFGTLRMMEKSEKYIMAHSIQPLGSLGELLSHLLEVTHCCVGGEKMLSGMGTSPVGNNGFQANSTVTSGSNGGDMQIDASGIPEDHKIVLKIISSYKDDEAGAERSDIREAAPPHLKSRIDEILEFLSGEGHIYTTKTDDFFKTI